MGYKFEFTQRAQKELNALPRMIAKRILRKMHWFSIKQDPLLFAVRLKDSKIGDLRFRIGDYRVIAFLYSEEKKISIASIGHRRDIYR